MGCWGTRCDETACPSGSGPLAQPGKASPSHRCQEMVSGWCWVHDGTTSAPHEAGSPADRASGSFVESPTWPSAGWVLSAVLAYSSKAFPCCTRCCLPMCPRTPHTPRPPSLPHSALPSAPTLQLLHHPEMWGRLHSCAKRSERFSCSPLAWFPPASPSCPPTPAPASCPLMCLRSFAPGQEPPARWR